MTTGGYNMKTNERCDEIPEVQVPQMVVSVDNVFHSDDDFNDMYVECSSDDVLLGLECSLHDVGESWCTVTSLTYRNDDAAMVMRWADRPIGDDEPDPSALAVGCEMVFGTHDIQHNDTIDIYEDGWPTLKRGDDVLSSDGPHRS